MWGSLQSARFKITIKSDLGEHTDPAAARFNLETREGPLTHSFAKARMNGAPGWSEKLKYSVRSLRIFLLLSCALVNRLVYSGSCGGRTHKLLMIHTGLTY